MRKLLTLCFGVTLASTACSASSSAPSVNDAGAPGADAGSDAANLDGSVVDAGDSCDAPASTTFACAAMPPGEGACQGGPPQAGDAGVGSSYPIGCVATLPSCNPFYAGEAMTCSCTPLGMTAMWVCAF